MERRLENVRVLITRPRERARELTFMLEDEGASVVALPVLELVPPADPRPLAAAAEAIYRYAWVIFASPSAVTALVEAAREAGTLDRLARCKLAAVGPRTAAAIRQHGFEVAREAAVGEQSGAGLFEAIRDALVAGDELLLPAAEEGRREFQEALEDRGISCTRVVAYRSESVEFEPAVVQALRDQAPDVTIFGSPRTVESFLERMGELGLAVLQTSAAVAIGPTTAGALEASGHPARAVAETPTPEGLVEAVVRAVRA